MIVINKVTELLPVERKNIEDAFNEGDKNGFEDKKIGILQILFTGKDYYNETYLKPLNTQ